MTEITMPKTRIHKKTRDRFKKAMRDVVDNLGRQIKIFKEIKRGVCPNCFYDKSTESSTGKCKWKTPLEAREKQFAYEAEGNTDLRYKYFKAGRCPICRGVGYLVTHKRFWVKCIVNWDLSTESNEIIHTQAGRGSSTVVTLKTDPKYINTFLDCKRIEVDGVSCILEAPPTIRGLGNQTVLLIRCIADSKLKKSSREKLKDYI